jgi:hypothetical protein
MAKKTGQDTNSKIAVLALEVLRAAERSDRTSMLELCDRDLARRVKRVRRHSGALQRMKVDEAAPVLEFLLSTGEDSDLDVAMKAVAREKRESLNDACVKVRSEYAGHSPELRESTLEMLEGATEAVVAEWSPATRLHPGVLTEWALSEGSKAVAAAHLQSLRRADVVLAAMRGEVTMSIPAFLDAARLDAYMQRRLLTRSAEYKGPLSAELFDLLVSHNVPLAEWEFSHVPDELITRAVRREGADSSLSEDVAVSWYSNGLIDGWKLVSEPLTVRQRKRIAVAATKRNDTALVNTVLARVEVDDTSYAAVDVAEVLDVRDGDRLSDHALLIAARECSPSQMLRWADRASLSQVRTVAQRGGAETARAVLNWRVPRRGLSAGVELLLTDLITGPHCGEALRTTSDSIAARVAEILHGHIGDDAEMWQIVLSFAGEWNASLDELLKSAAACLGRK